MNNNLIECKIENGNKKVILDYKFAKKFIIILILIFILVFTIAFGFSKSINVNHIKTENTMSLKIISLSIIYGILLLFFLFFYPLKLELIIKNDSLIVKKTEAFYIPVKKVIKINQYTIIYGKKKRWIGNTVYLGKGPYYQGLIKYKENGLDKELNLILTSFYFSHGGGYRKLLERSDLESIGKYLGLKVVLEK